MTARLALAGSNLLGADALVTGPACGLFEQQPGVGLVPFDGHLQGRLRPFVPGMDIGAFLDQEACGLCLAKGGGPGKSSAVQSR